MLNLPDLTIWTIVWNDDKKWIIRAGQVLRYCKTIINCPRTILFTHDKIADREYPWDTIQIPKLDWQSYNLFINRVVPNYINTQFAMSTHEDGYPLEPSLWDSAFLEYDYIGAPWSDNVVGNGGFNIESRKLMELKQTMPMTDEDFHVPSDRLVCTTRRQWLEERGVRFAPLFMALRFSTEQIGGEKPSFGFHGRTASPEKYRQGWKTINSMNLTPARDGFTRVGNKIVPPPKQIKKPMPAARGSIFQPFVPVIFPTAKNMKVTVVYVYPLVAGTKYHDYADRFIESYKENPPGAPHDTVIVFNGGKSDSKVQGKFVNFPNYKFISHDNSGYDLGAFQKASRQCLSDIIVFFGASTYLNGTGWLARMIEATVKHGHALYGAMGNKGDDRYQVWPHIRTTAFWMHPSLFNAWPKTLSVTTQRHAFEHGKDCFTGWVNRRGLKAWVVTWGGEYEWENWDDDLEGFQRGHQKNLLAGDHICEKPYFTPKS